MNELDHLKYPIGKFEWGHSHSHESVAKGIQSIETLPSLLLEQVERMNDRHLSTSYRPGGWTGRQVIHHLADSHINGYIRFKLALTEQTPIIKPYIESLWALTPEVKDVPVEYSMQILNGLHRRWASLLKKMNKEDFDKKIIHPEHGRVIPLSELTVSYGWHGMHHIAHLKLITG